MCRRERLASGDGAAAPLPGGATVGGERDGAREANVAVALPRSGQGPGARDGRPHHDQHAGPRQVHTQHRMQKALEPFCDPAVMWLPAAFRAVWM